MRRTFPSDVGSPSKSPSYTSHCCSSRRWSRYPDTSSNTPSPDIVIPAFYQSLLRMPSCKDARHEAQHIRRAHVAVAVVIRQPALDDVDLLLCRLVHDARHQARQLDRVFLVLEQLQLQGLLQTL